MSILLFKLTAGPLLIALVTQVTRRFGPSAGGWLVGFPLTSGPISVFLALEQGTDYAATAAITSLVGAGTVSLFCLVYALCAARFSRLMTLGAALTGYLASVGVLSHIPFTIGTGLAALVAIQGLCLCLRTRRSPCTSCNGCAVVGHPLAHGSDRGSHPCHHRPCALHGTAGCGASCSLSRLCLHSCGLSPRPGKLQCPAPLFARGHHLHLGCRYFLVAALCLKQMSLVATYVLSVVVALGLNACIVLLQKRHTLARKC